MEPICDRAEALESTIVHGSASPAFAQLLEAIDVASPDNRADDGKDHSPGGDSQVEDQDNGLGIVSNQPQTTLAVPSIPQTVNVQTSNDQETHNVMNSKTRHHKRASSGVKHQIYPNIAPNLMKLEHVHVYGEESRPSSAQDHQSIVPSTAIGFPTPPPNARFSQEHMTHLNKLVDVNDYYLPYTGFNTAHHMQQSMLDSLPAGFHSPFHSQSHLGSHYSPRQDLPSASNHHSPQQAVYEAPYTPIGSTLPTSFERTSVKPTKPQTLQPSLQSPFGSPTFKSPGTMAPQKPKRRAATTNSVMHANSGSTAFIGKLADLPDRRPNPHAKAEIRKAINKGHSYADREWIQALVDAMKDTTYAEDNPGMRDTWTKLMMHRADRMFEVATQLLELVDERTTKNVPLSSKRSTHHYPNMYERFAAIWKMLQTQKTICKHLLEDPYACQVVDDPAGATKRVKNNRRVNDQKRQAITAGRDMLGYRGRGKGAPLQKIEDASDTETEDYGAEASEQEESEYEEPKAPAKRPRRAATKRQYKDPMDDTGDSALPSPSKRSRRGLRQRTWPPVPALNTNVTPVSGSSHEVSSNDVSNPSPGHGFAYSYASNTPIEHVNPRFTPAVCPSHRHHGLPSYDSPALTSMAHLNYTDYGFPAQHYHDDGVYGNGNVNSLPFVDGFGHVMDTVNNQQGNDYQGNSGNYE